MRISQFFYQLVRDEEITRRQRRLVEFVPMLGRAIANDDARAQWAISGNIRLAKAEIAALQAMTPEAVLYVESVIERRMRENASFRTEVELRVDLPPAINEDR